VSWGQECWSRTLRKQSTGWPEHDSKDRTTGDGTTVAGNRDRTVGKGQPRHVILDRTDISGKDMTITTGQRCQESCGQGCLKKTAGTGQGGQEN
jgi:hypothetical protein